MAVGWFDEGVEGGFDADAGGALGYSHDISQHIFELKAFLAFEIMQTMKPFSSILQDSTVSSFFRILPVAKSINCTHGGVDTLFLNSCAYQRK